MASYRVHYCRADGSVFAAQDVEATQDSDAITRARTLAERHTAIFEVWRGDRLIHGPASGTKPGSGGKPPPAMRLPHK